MTSAVDEVRFWFELREIADVVPWGDAESGPCLHWFGLTDGWYDMILAGHRLFSSSEDPRGLDYQVVRLWEDLIDVAPFALEPVPDALAERLVDIEAWKSWVKKTEELEPHDEIASTGLEWWWQREMPSPPFDDAPHLQTWRIGEEIHLEWRIPSGSDESPWASPRGRARVAASAFRAELLRFDRALIAAMDARVTSVEQAWNRPEIAIDARELRREQGERSKHLDRAFRHRSRAGRLARRDRRPTRCAPRSGDSGASERRRSATASARGRSREGCGRAPAQHGKPCRG